MRKGPLYPHVPKTKQTTPSNPLKKVLIVYDSVTGNTERMAKEIEQGAREMGVEVELKRVDEAKASDLEAADGIILGSPTYYGSMTKKMKQLIDDSVGSWGKLSNKAGAAFASSGLMGGGGETTALSIIQAMLNHEMVIVGGALGTEAINGSLEHQGSLYGAICVSPPDATCQMTCRMLGKRVASLVKQLG